MRINATRMGLLLALCLAHVGCQKLKERFFKKSEKPTEASAPNKESLSAVYLAVREGEIVDSLEIDGSVKAANRIELRTESKTRVGKVLVTNLQQVKRGQLLIEVDRTEIEQKLRQLVDQIATQRIELDSEKIKYNFTKKVLERKKALVGKGIAPQKELDDAQRDAQLAEASLQTRELNFAKAEREANEAKEQLKSANFYAPMDGIVSNLVAPQPGEDVQPGTVLAVVSDPSTLALWGGIDEMNATRLSVGAKVGIRLSAFGDKIFNGAVKEVAVGAMASSGGGLKSYGVRFDFDAQGQAVKEGFRGSALIKFASNAKALTVPASAVQYLDGKEHLMVASSEGGRAKARPVVIGIKTAHEVEVKDGLAAGEFVVVGGTR